MSEEIFEIHVTFAYGGDNEPMIETCKMSGLKDAISRLMYGPFASIGGIKGFKIIDSEDFVVFSVSDGKVIFPNQNQME
jgi:hypothetical protein